MSDAGAIARNVQHNQIALERAAQRNGGQNIPASPPSSVTGTDSVPSRAVDVPHPYVGTIDEASEALNKAESVVSTVPVVGPVVSAGIEAAKEGAEIGEELAHPVDSALSWGRGGEIEASVGWGDKPQPGAATGIFSSGTLTAQPPDTFGAGPQPDVNRNQSWNMHDIANYKIGG